MGKQSLCFFVLRFYPGDETGCIDDPDWVYEDIKDRDYMLLQYSPPY